VAALNAPLAGTKLGPGAPPVLPPVPRDPTPDYKLAPDEPLYIGDEAEGIEFGDLREDPSKAVVTAEIVGPVGRRFTRTNTPTEPVARAAGDSVRRFGQWWNNGPMSTAAKIALLVAAALFAAIHGGWLLVAAVMAGCVYVVYQGFRLFTGA